MGRRTFWPHYQPSKGFLIDGRLLSEQAEASNALANERPAGASQSTINGAIRATNNPPKPLEFGIAIITDASSHPLYSAKFRVYHASTDTWANYNETLSLDVSVYGDDDVAGDVPYYEVGDIVPAYWDTTRISLIPIHTPSEGGPEGGGTLSLAEFKFFSSSTTVPMTLTYQQQPTLREVEACLEVNEPDDGNWRAVSIIRWHIAPDEHEWRCTRGGIGIFSALQNASRGTWVRLRVVKGGGVEEDVSVISAELRFHAISKVGTNATASNLVNTVILNGGTVLSSVWFSTASVTGTIDNSPAFTESTPGLFEVNYNNTPEEWVIAAEYQVAIEAEAEGGQEEQVYIAKTGADGIPPMCERYDGYMHPGSATVTLYKIQSPDDILVKCLDASGNERTKTAYNLSFVAVAPFTFIHIKREDCTNKWLVDFDPCGTPEPCSSETSGSASTTSHSESSSSITTVLSASSASSQSDLSSQSSLSSITTDLSHLSASSWSSSSWSRSSSSSSSTSSCSTATMTTSSSSTSTYLYPPISSSSTSTQTMTTSSMSSQSASSESSISSRGNSSSSSSFSIFVSTEPASDAFASVSDAISSQST